MDPPHQVWGTSVALHLKRMEYFNWEKRRHGAEKAGGACLAFFSLPSPPPALGAEWVRPPPYEMFTVRGVNHSTGKGGFLAKMDPLIARLR